MIMKKKRRLKPFIKIVLGYALVFFILLAVGLYFFWQYIDQYEKTRSQTVISQYVESMQDDKKEEIAESYLDSIDCKEYARSDALDIIKNQLTDLSYAKAVKESSENKTVYMLKNDTSVCGKITMIKEDDPFLSFSSWNIDKEEFDFSYLINEKDYTLPESYRILYDDKPIQDEILVEDKIPIEMLKDYYDTYTLPYICKYHLEGIIDFNKIQILDENGNASDGSYDEIKLLNNADQESMQAIKDFIPTFLDFYIQCLSNSNHDAKANYEALYPYLVPNGNLAIRIYEAIDGQYWAPSNGDTVTDITINYISYLGGNLYLADITYGLDTIGEKGLYHSDNTARIFIEKNDAGNYLATDIATY